MHVVTKKADPTPPKADPLFTLQPTPSMRATRKYFYRGDRSDPGPDRDGAITAHYAVEGQSFFGLPLAQFLPFVVSRTIHTQFAVLWIATAWLATGLYIAPAISGVDPEVPETGRGRAVLRAAVHRGRLHRHRLAGSLQHRAVTLPSGSATRGLEFTSMGRVWQSCCSSACCSGCSCWAGA